VIHTIRINEVLRETTHRSLRDLVTRPTGAAIRNRIQEAMLATPHPTTRLDFSEVGFLDFSCADEIVAKLLRDSSDDRYLVLWHLDDAQAEAIDHVLERQNLAVVAVPRGGSPMVLGAASAELRLAFRAVLEGGPGDAPRLASRLAWSLDRAADALLLLALRRLVLAAQGTFSPLPLQ
jgi:hypothetical protein